MSTEDNTSLDAPAKRLKKELDTLKMEDIKTDLVLPWSLRDKLIYQLNKYNAFLYSKFEYGDDLKRELVDEAKQLVTELMLLNLKDEEDRFKKLFQIEKGSKKVAKDQRCNLPTLNLRWSKRQKIFDILMLNQKTIVYADIGETKKSIIEENDKILFDLMKLSVIVYEDEDKKKNEIPSNNQRLLNDQLSDQINFETTSTKDLWKQEFYKEFVAEMDKKFVSLRDELTQLVHSNSEIVYTFKVSNVSTFLMENNQKRMSELFYCRNVPFVVAVKNRLTNNDSTPDVLDVYIHCEYQPKSTNWKLCSKITIKLLSNVCDSNQLTSKFDFEYVKKQGVGIPQFVTHQELKNCSKQYIKNDSFCLICHVICDLPVGN